MPCKFQVMQSQLLIASWILFIDLKPVILEILFCGTMGVVGSALGILSEPAS